MTGDVAPAKASKTPLSSSTKVALFAMALGVFLIANDFTALSVAIPDIETDLHSDITRAQWVINGYALTFGVLLVTGGRLADLYGRKRVFMVGATVFGLFSLVSGLVDDVDLLIGGRVLMGIGGALMWPAILGMVYALLPDDRASLAGALLLGMCGVGNAFGPLLGGFLTDVLSWRWVFFVNVPVTAFAMLVTWRKVDETRVETAERRLDVVGVTLVTFAVVAILIALDEGPDDGFGDPFIVGLLVVGALLLATFVVVERRIGEHALVPRRVLGNRVFVWCAFTVLLMSSVFFAMLLYLPQLFQKVLGWDALGAGAGLLPVMALFAGVSFASGPLYDRLGGRAVVALGAALLGVGMFVTAALVDQEDYWVLVPGMVFLGVGVGLFYSSITTVAVTTLDASESSLAGGIVYMCQIAGGAVGLGINTAIVATADSLTAGITRAFVVDGALAVVALVVVLRALAGHEPTHARTLVRFHRAHA